MHPLHIPSEYVIKRIVYTPMPDYYLYIKNGSPLFGDNTHGRTYLIQPTDDQGFKLIEVLDFPKDQREEEKFHFQEEKKDEQ